MDQMMEFVFVIRYPIITKRPGLVILVIGLLDYCFVCVALAIATNVGFLFQKSMHIMRLSHPCAQTDV